MEVKTAATNAVNVYYYQLPNTHSVCISYMLKQALFMKTNILAYHTFLSICISENWGAELRNNCITSLKAWAHILMPVQVKNFYDSI